jgi:ABC-2 type transport system permease protein
MKHTTKYIWIAYTTARSHIAYSGEVFARIAFLAVILYVFSRIWLSVYGAAGGGLVGGLTLPQMIWYLVATEAVFMSAPRIWLEVEQDVRTGRLAVQLIRPVSYVLSHLAKAFGERIPRFATSLLIGSIIAWALVGPIQWTPAGIAMFLAILPLAFLLDFLGCFLVGLCAFWLESVNGIAVIYTRAIMLLGGVILPLEIYPEVLQPILRKLPFASMSYAPGRMFVDPQGSLFLDALGTQALALVVFLCIVAAVQTAALKRVFSNGG